MCHLSSSDSHKHGKPGFDPWLKIQDFLTTMNESFNKHFVPSQNVCIDESVIGMKNRSAFIQYKLKETCSLRCKED